MKCLYLAAYWPLPSLSAAGRRTWDILDALTQQLGAQIHIACHAEVTAKWQQWAMSKSVAYQRIELNRDSFDDWIKTLKPDWVIFDRFLTEEQYGWRVERHLPDALKILDMQDWHALRHARLEALKQMHLEVDVTTTPVFQRELASMLRSDLVLVISDAECQKMQQVLQPLGIGTQVYPNHRQQHPEQKRGKSTAIATEIVGNLCVRLAYFPFVHPFVSAIASKKFEQRQHFVFVGNFLHQPNVEGVYWLRERIWPRVKQALPTVECHVYGAFADTKIQHWHQAQQGFLIKGVLAEDVQSALNGYRINLAPLRFGAGLKGKVFDAALWGTPTIMTPIAAEGLFSDDTPGIAGSEACLESSLAQAMIRFYQCRQDWYLMRDNQQAHILENFKQSVWNPQLAEALQQVQQAPVFGSFLQTLINQQGHKANAYFSRWIELKETKCG